MSSPSFVSCTWVKARLNMSWKISRSVDPDLWAALRTLDVRTRTALLLNVVDGYTQREVGAILGVPEGTVASWLSRGRAALRRELDRDG